MSPQHKATPRADRSDENGKPLAQTKSEQAVVTNIGHLKDASPVSVQQTRSARMADVLEQLAAINAFSEISDPVAWQREQRDERLLPSRGE